MQKLHTHKTKSLTITWSGLSTRNLHCINQHEPQQKLCIDLQIIVLYSRSLPTHWSHTQPYSSIHSSPTKEHPPIWNNQTTSWQSVILAQPTNPKQPRNQIAKPKTNNTQNSEQALRHIHKQKNKKIKKWNKKIIRKYIKTITKTKDGTKLTKKQGY